MIGSNHISKGCGFVIFEKPESAQNAINKGAHDENGQNIIANQFKETSEIMESKSTQMINVDGIIISE